MATGMAWPVRAITARSSSAARTDTGSRLTRPYRIGRWVVATGERPKRESRLVKTTLIVLAAAASLSANPAFAQSWQSSTFDGGVSAWSSNKEFADVSLSCSDDEIPAVSIGLPMTEIPEDISQRLILSVDGQDLEASWGFEINRTGTGVSMQGDSNAHWHTVRGVSEKIAQGQRLTVLVPSLGFETNFDLQGARDAMAPVMEKCGLNR